MTEPERTTAKRGVARPIRVVGDPVLREKCAPVTIFDDHLQQLIADMFASMYAADGVGLAANQIGVPWRLFVYDCPDAADVMRKGVVVNPRLVEVSGRRENSEGCLSVPGPHELLARADGAVCEGVDETGAPVRVEGTGVLAQCLQHETDHLDGVLYVDRLTPVARRRAMDSMQSPAPTDAPRGALG